MVVVLVLVLVKGPAQGGDVSGMTMTTTKCW